MECWAYEIDGGRRTKTAKKDSRRFKEYYSNNREM